MATIPNSTRWLRRAAFASGLVAAVTLVALGRIPAGSGPLVLNVDVTTAPTGELAVEPAGRVAAVTGLAPGGGALRGRVTLRNQTDAPLAVRVRARPSISDADISMQVTLSGSAGELYSGPAAGLRRFSRRALSLEPRGSAVVDVAASLPPGAPEGWRGRDVTLPLEYRTSVRGQVRR
jgi:hypothetical protein